MLAQQKHYVSRLPWLLRRSPRVHKENPLIFLVFPYSNIFQVRASEPRISQDVRL